MNYTFHQLQIFLKVCELGSITKASEELFLTQPAVSIQLKKLQDQFEIPLTELIGRKIYITDFGKEIETAAKKILIESDNITTITDQFKGLLTGQISISVVSTGKYVLPYFLGNFFEKHPSINLDMDVTNKAKVISSLVNNEVDFALVSVLPGELNVKKVELMENILHLVSNKSSKATSLKKLDNKPFIFREEGSATRNAMEAFLTSKNITSTKKLVLTSNEAVKQAVCAGLGYSIMPLIGMKNELNNGSLKIIKSKGLPIVTSWNLIYNMDKKLSPAAKALLKHIEITKNDVIDSHFSMKQ